MQRTVHSSNGGMPIFSNLQLWRCYDAMDFSLLTKPKNGKNEALGRYFFFLETIKILFRVSQSLSLFFRFSAYEKGKKDIEDRL